MQQPSLSWLEQQWASWFTGENDLVVLTFLTFVIHEISYFGRHIPFLIAEKIPALDKYKLQPDKKISDEQWWKCIKSVLIGHWLFELPLMFGFHPVAAYAGMKISEVPLPSWSEVCWQVFLFMLFEDFFHYVAHRALHEPYLYKVIHKQHHEFAAPFGLAAEYAHPLEVLILSLGTFGGPILYCAATNGQFHVFTALVWSSVKTFQAVDAHSGYDFPWSLHNIIPFWSGAEHHDYHHQAFIGNYAASFRWWDYLFGTDKNYKAYKERQKLKMQKIAQAGQKAQGFSRSDSKVTFKTE